MLSLHKYIQVCKVYTETYLIVTGTMMTCSCSFSSWAFNAGCCGNETRRGIWTQMLVASGCSLMKNNSPGNIQRTPSKTFGNSRMRSSAVTCSSSEIVKLLISDDVWSGSDLWMSDKSRVVAHGNNTVVSCSLGKCCTMYYWRQRQPLQVIGRGISWVIHRLTWADQWDLEI